MIVIRADGILEWEVQNVQANKSTMKGWFIYCNCNIFAKPLARLTKEKDRRHR